MPMTTTNANRGRIPRLTGQRRSHEYGGKSEKKVAVYTLKGQRAGGPDVVHKGNNMLRQQRCCN